MSAENEERPYDGGSQPVTERPPEMPRGGNAAARAVAIAVGVLVVLAALAWVLVPFGG